MDEIDLKLTALLETNARLSYRELAEISGLSINAVHKRIQYLIDVGNIQGFIATLGPAVERHIRATAFGKTDSKDIERTIVEAGLDEHTSQVAVATNDFLYPQWYLRNISELDDFIVFVKETTQIASPEVVFRSIPPPSGYEDVKLSGLDYRIINALMEDARRPEKDVAEELGISPKTVHRHLSRMQREGSIYLYASLRTTSTPDIFSFVHVSLKKNVDRRDAMAHLMERYQPNILSVTPVDSLPDWVLATVWTQTMDGLKGVRVRLEQEDVIETLSVNIFYDFHRFDTWREELVRKRAAEAARRG